MKKLILVPLLLYAITCYGTIPAAPSNFVATDVTSAQVDFAWQDNSSDEDGFSIHRLINGSYTKVGSVLADVTTFSDSNVVRGETYSYKVRAFNNSGGSTFSNAVIVAIPSSNPTPTGTPTPTPGDTPTPTPTASPTPSATPVARYALSHDGNYHDRDDICALPMALALFSKSGKASQVVYVGYGNHFWLNNNGQESDMATSTTVDTVSTWGGFDTNDFYDERGSGNAVNQTAISALKTEILVSTPANPLIILAAGPMQTVGMALAAANKVDPTRAKSVTVISHSQWNDTHAGNSGPSEGLAAPRYNWSELGSLGAHLVHIKDQNQTINGTYAQYSWMNGNVDPKIQWLWDRGQAAGKNNFDCSDAGMSYYAIYGDDSPSPAKVKSVLTAP